MRELNLIGSRIRAVIVSHHSWATSILAGIAAGNIIIEENETPVIVEATPVHRPTIESVLGQKGVDPTHVMYTGFPPGRVEGKPLIIHSVGYDISKHKSFLLSNMVRIRVILLHANKGVSVLLRYPLFRLVHLRDKVFKVSRPGRRTSVVEISVEGVREVREKESTIEKQALNAVIDAMSEFGQLSVKDAVNIIAANLELPRQESRKILYKLVSEGRLKVRRGIIEL